MTNTKHHNPPIQYRPDIDGLRAIAILLVIIFHAFPKFLRGGFIGVDIFFVISGYLITAIILKGLSRENFSLLEFYSRRIKRIFPALIVVLSFCLIAGWYVLLAGEYEILGKHIAAGSIYMSNFVLQSEAGYFDKEAELKPLMHLWSLAVEEQFYLFFPLLLILSHRLRINALGVIIIGFAISFALNVSQITDKPSEVFFYPQSRIWELLIGSAAAYITLQTHLLKIRTQKSANFLSILGLVFILFAWVYLENKKIYFPYYWALLPTLGAACLILAGEKAWFNQNILASKVAVFIGLISYPLYLWHWVLLSFIHITEVEKPKPFLKIALLILSLFLAWLTYFLIEKNIRFQKEKFVSTGLFTVLLVIGLSGYIVHIKKGYQNRFNIKEIWSEGELGTEVYRNSGLISQKTCVDKYKSIIEGDLLDEKLPEYEFCLLQNIDLAPTALLLGDSHANHLYSGLETNTDLTGGNLLNLGRGGCTAFGDLQFQEEKCQDFVNRALEMAISNASIKTVILTNRTFKQKENDRSYLKKMMGLQQSTEEKFYIEIRDGMKNTLRRLLDVNKKIFFILDTPKLNFLPEQCIMRPWRLSGELIKYPCAILRSEVDRAQKKYLEVITGVLKEFPEVRVFDPLPAFCDESYCWAIKDGKMLYRDNEHLSAVGSIYLGEYFKQ
ncbi:MAG: hypothetical protein RLZZ66_1988 [Pseudomonadota bacterium]|jgi:peptidoglycan/LPS O-acetylase OafA/YrhL